MKLTHLHSSTLTAFNDRGFTLVELMVAVAISGIVAAVISSAYISQRRTSTAQEQVVEMQQNIRAGLDIMEHDIRMAGYDPKNSTPTPTITTATATQLLFTMLVEDPIDAFDNDNDGSKTDGDEVETFGYWVADTTPVGDGFTALGRQHKALFVAVAENIDAIEFYYTLNNGTQTTAPTAAQLNDIRAVQISILARAGRADQDFTNTMTYTPASGNSWDLNGATAGTAPNDNFRRRLHITTIQCRNMGL
ncbi:MAG: prepilin-type N-terminal cleavage/methylation domain-containing protein [Chlorobium sp.]|nr:prepilin-type N-terminal cleavage/methylation domain-containing protein [Chlorobium sp.]